MELAHNFRQTCREKVSELGPGLWLTCGIALAAFGAEAIEIHLFGVARVESLVLAILMGAIFRSSIPLPDRFKPGIRFAAKTLLEIAIVLLGASISVQALEVAGGPLVLGIVILVLISLMVSYGIGRLAGLHHALALLVACGNSICGNSAIAAAAPVIRAKPDDVAASIAFTAVLGVVVVLALPICIGAFSMSVAQYGTLAGLTVYAVPQVLAAAHPAGLVAVQTGTLVKLVRVMMLGPVLFGLGLLTARRREDRETEAGKPVIDVKQIVPWFIIGFALMMGLRSVDLIPVVARDVMTQAATLLTILAMAALGLGVDIRTLSHSSGRVVTAAALSVLALIAMSLLMIAALQL
ncbi:MAG: putative sulfate exporter family transporter [Rhodobacteraceae bacterium]|nr:putative sulfate exporter family transporter [Paracoccaceae bacterium]